MSCTGSYGFDPRLQKQPFYLKLSIEICQIVVSHKDMTKTEKFEEVSSPIVLPIDLFFKEANDGYIHAHSCL